MGPNHDDATIRIRCVKRERPTSGETLRVLHDFRMLNVGLRHTLKTSLEGSV
jgi:hypothetical protein